MLHQLLFFATAALEVVLQINVYLGWLFLVSLLPVLIAWKLFVRYIERRDQ